LFTQKDQNVRESGLIHKMVLPTIKCLPQAELVLPTIKCLPQAELVLPTIKCLPQAELVLPTIKCLPQAESFWWYLYQAALLS